MTITGMILFSIVPVFADGDGNVYFIPEEKYLAYSYWINHTTNDYQKYILDNSGLNIEMTRSDINTYTLTTYASEAAKDRIIANLEAAGATVTSSAYSFTDNYGTRMYIINYQIPEFDTFNTTSGYEENYLLNIYMYPHIEGTYSSNTSYTDSDFVFLTTGTYIFACMGNESSSNIYLYGADGTTNITASRKRPILDTWMKLDYYEFTITKNQRYTINLSGLRNKYIRMTPVYFGQKDYMPISVSNLLAIDSTDRTILNDIKTGINNLVSGNTQSNNAVNNLNNVTSDFNTSVNNIETTETLAKNNFNTSMNNISTNIDLTGNASFLAAMTWVSTQYTNIVSNNPIQYVLMFCLVLGIALTIIGKVRNR